MTDIHVRKIYCHNFRVFKDRQIEGLVPGTNIFIGDNDTGKSSVLLAIDLVLRASVSRVEGIGLESLLNREVVVAFQHRKDRTFGHLPTMEVNLFLSDIQQHEYEGPHNFLREESCGISLICRPRDNLKESIDQVIQIDDGAFPFEYYAIEFKTFSGAPLT